MDCLSSFETESYVRREFSKKKSELIENHLSSCTPCMEAVQSTSIRLELSANGTKTFEVDGSDALVEEVRHSNQSDYLAEGTRNAQPGDFILGYQLKSKIGRGAMGETWNAQRENEVEPVALKTLPASLRSTPVELDRVRRMFDMVKTLRHPNIAAVYQLGEDPTWGPVLIMELVDGITLRQYLTEHGDDDGKLALDHAIRILEPVAGALDYAHKSGVVHRDIKPSNIMLKHDGSDVRLIDFGLMDEIRQSLVNLSVVVGEVAGTAPYMSPEQWRGHIPSAASDEYALGCLAYELLSGRTPFVASDSNVLRQCHIEEAVPTLQGVPDSVCQVFWQAAASGARRCALAKTRSERFDTCSGFVHALRSSGSKPQRAEFIRRAFKRDGSRGLGLDLPFVECPQVPGVHSGQEFMETQSAVARALGIPRTIQCDLGISMALIPPGRFVFGIGSSPTIDEQGLERPRTTVIDYPFYLARWTVSCGTWKAVMNQWRSSTCNSASRRWQMRFLGGRNRQIEGPDIYCPVDDIMPADAADFVGNLNQNDEAQMVPGRNLTFRLPSEAEWEYACRAGSTTRYFFGDDQSPLDKYVWHRANSRRRVHRTAMLAPNVVSLSDMLGNVWEWCQEGVLRGGSARESASNVTSNSRMTKKRFWRRDRVGLRVVATFSNRR